MDKSIKRITYLDNAKGIGIILVIMGHIYMNIDHLRIIYAFHMPLFFVISGILLHIKKEYNGNFRTFFIKKTKSLMIPYLSFSIIYMLIYLIEFIINCFKTDIFDPTTLFTLFTYTVTLDGIELLWFLPSLWGAELLVTLLIKALSKSKMGEWCIHLILAGCLFITSILFWFIYTKFSFGDLIYVTIVANSLLEVISRIFITSFFIEFAYFVILLTNLNIKKFIKPLIGLLLLIICAILSQYLGEVNFGQVVFSYICPAIFNAMIGSAGIILISTIIPENKILSFYGQNSLIVFLTHFGLIIGWIMILMNKFNSVVHFNNDIINYCIFIFGTLILTMICEIPIIIFINKCVPFIIGKNKPKHKNNQ